MTPNSRGVEILSIGTELLLGNIINTNSQWISEQLSQLGLNHFRQSTVGDNCDRIIKEIQEISKRSNLLITTGGLGPTPDDLTTEAIAKSFNETLFERPHLWDEIKQKLSNSMLQDDSSSLRKQCFFPKNAQIINNPRGTAPGMIWEPIKGFTILTFPGVPSEMKTMWKETAFEYIKTKFSDSYSFFSNTLKFAGIGESSLAEKINELLNLKNPTVAPYANLGEVKLRITARAKNEVEAKNIIKPVKEKLKKEFSKFIFGEDNDTLPSVLIKELTKRNQTIVFAESCTGGLLSSSLTSITGSSQVFQGSIVSYSNELKNLLLNISQDKLNEYGAVSEEVCEAMAINVKNRLGADWAIAISGIAGPNGGTQEKPVGLVYISIAGPNNHITNIKKIFNSTRNRIEIQTLSVNVCLNSLRLILLSNSK
ncbi:competence/damage-inducible protein A [Prochlorococcus marinus XMU1411]|uniref:competence/damage-inducible protein A n=1 Tax=Prochlorococcus marinus TaxID=1219 RepID=UPI001ADC6762|nr:competence/damage-inducible protein A [Prochlorococcus marinus]MBO8243133.1 competence/damage-inducible protein A [Prochlorococcus marinus XMU1411]MBW3054252.1 competence/damage-inducible protein A [Prochlorococcus marinus str. MU1411]MCR8537824.1 competence/damage-inducible protein A [Prochlorococcus marinus CUG1430]